MNTTKTTTLPSQFTSHGSSRCYTFCPPPALKLFRNSKQLLQGFWIPNEVVSDNGLNSPALNFRSWQDSWTAGVSCLVLPNLRGTVMQRAVQTAKRILRQEDSLIALMNYRSTPCITTGGSPVAVLMRKIMTTLATPEKNRRHKWTNRETV